MHYCEECDRYFELAEGLQQHRENSHRHAFDSPSITSAVPVLQLALLSSQATTSSPPMFGAQPAGSVTQAARDTAGDEPSKDLIDSLKGYDHFALVPLSLELLGIDNSLRLGSTLAGHTQISWYPAEGRNTMCIGPSYARSLSSSPQLAVLASRSVSGSLNACNHSSLTFPL